MKTTDSSAVFTIAARNYLPRALALGDSLRRVDPSLAFYIVLADEWAAGDRADELPYPTLVAETVLGRHYRDMAFKYDVVELATAIKPFAFLHLFAETQAAALIYLDPDILVFRPLDGILSMLEHARLVLTPHVTTLTGLDRDRQDLGFLRHGAFNLGFVAARREPATIDLMRWWSERVRTHGYCDVADGLYVDQKWLDLVSSVEPLVCVNREPTYNAAQWNIHERRLTGDGNGFCVNGQPLVFFHFSGFDPNTPNRVPGLEHANDRDAYRRLFADYARAVQDQRKFEGDYAFARFENGVPIARLHRRLYRRLTEDGPHWANPFAASPQSFYSLLARSGLLMAQANSGRPLRRADFPHASARLRGIKVMLRAARRVMGIRKYSALAGVLRALGRPEEQTFLLADDTLRRPTRFDYSL